MVSPPSGPLDEQQLRARRGRDGGCGAQPRPARQVVGGVVAQRVAVGHRGGEPLGQRRGLHHLQPHPAYRRPPGRRPGSGRRPRCARPRCTGRPGRPGARRRCDRARRCGAISTDLPSGQPLVAAAAPRGQVAAQRGQHLARLDDRVAPAQQAARELTAQRRVDGADRGRVEQLEPAPVRVGQRRRLLQQAELGVVDGQGERAGGPEAEAGHLGAQFLPQLAGPQRQASSGPARRPLTQTRPKFLTLAPRASASRSSCTTSKPRRRAATACMVPSTPPPTTTTRCVIPRRKYSHLETCIANFQQGPKRDPGREAR